MTQTDLLGRPLDAHETELLRIYEALKTLAAQPGLAPCAARNVRKALACLWQIVTDLDLEFEQLYDVDV